jgi:hypothetical protein
VRGAVLAVVLIILSAILPKKVSWLFAASGNWNVEWEWIAGSSVERLRGTYAVHSLPTITLIRILAQILALCDVERVGGDDLVERVGGAGEELAGVAMAANVSNQPQQYYIQLPQWIGSLGVWAE